MSRCLSMGTRELRILSHRAHSTRARIRKHKEPILEKKHMLTACEPYHFRDHTPPSQKCRGEPTKVILVHPLEEILARELVEEIKSSGFVLFLQYNYTPFIKDRKWKNIITKSGGTFHDTNNRVYREVFQTLGRVDLWHLLIGRNALITGPIEKLPSCFQAISANKMSSYILLGGMIDNNMFNIDQLKAISVNPNIDQCRANLLNLLQTPAIDLASNLQQYFEMNNPGSSDGDKP